MLTEWSIWIMSLTSLCNSFQTLNITDRLLLAGSTGCGGGRRGGRDRGWGRFGRRPRACRGYAMASRRCGLGGRCSMSSSSSSRCAVVGCCILLQSEWPRLATGLSRLMWWKSFYLDPVWAPTWYVVCTKVRHLWQLAAARPLGCLSLTRCDVLIKFTHYLILTSTQNSFQFSTLQQTKFQ